MRQRSQTDPFQLDAGFILCIPNAERLSREEGGGRDVVTNTQLREGLNDLECACNALACSLVRPIPSDIPPLEEHPARSRRVDAGNDIDQGRFAGAVRSDETQNLARSNLQIDRLQGLKTTKTPRDRLESQESLGHRIIFRFRAQSRR